MATTPYTDSAENARQARQITYHMLTGMLDALDTRDYITNPANFTARRAEMEDTLRMEQPALPLEYMEEPDEYEVSEHRAIMTPNNNLEGIEAITEHLGELIKPNITVESAPRITAPDNQIIAGWLCFANETTHQSFYKDGHVYTICGKQHTVQAVKTPKHMSLGSGLTNLEKIIYYDAAMTGQGDVVAPHENHAPRAWFKYAGGVQHKFNCTTEQATTLALAFKILDTTPKMAAKFASWLSTEGKFAAGFKYFENLAIQMVLVTDEGEPTIITDNYIESTNTAEPVDADNPAYMDMLPAVTYHKLDDPRDKDFDEEKNMTTWERRQPKDFHKVIASIKNADMPTLKAIGKNLFNDKRFNKTQTTVIWGAYNRRKHALTPKLRPLALKALERMVDPKVNLSKVAAWLNGDGKKALNVHELSTVWSAWKKVKAAKAPKQAAMNMMPVPPADYNMGELEYLYN